MSGYLVSGKVEVRHETEVTRCKSTHVKLS